jgi:hypothetical protein
MKHAITTTKCHNKYDILVYRSRRGRDRTVVGFTTIYAIGVYHRKRCEFEFHPGEVYSIKHDVIKFVSDLRKVGGFLHQ